MTSLSYLDLIGRLTDLTRLATPPDVDLRSFFGKPFDDFAFRHREAPFGHHDHLDLRV